MTSLPNLHDDATLRRALLAWYRRHRRDLPWRRTRDPWAIWVSEIMLQQTQVATAAPYYRSFLARFPTVRALARAKSQHVLAAWAGLGYYRRARMLHEAARVVVREHAGVVPGEPGAFAALPGVGRYTAGAVQSIAFGRALPVLDGNVARVFARLSARPLSVKRPADARVLWSLAESLVPKRSPGDWNQALMELGATVCTPRAPRCDACPVRRWCAAFAEGDPERYPAVVPRRASERVRRAVAWVEHGGRVLLVRREGPLLDGLWEPPGVELADGDDAGAALRAALRALGVRAALEDTGARVKHGITYRAIEVEVWQGTARGAVRATPARRWVEPAAPGVPASALTGKVRAAVATGSARTKRRRG
jgi:A/G-specific adenine glycosylase